MTRNEGRFEVQILATVLLILLLSAVADHHVVVASAPNVAASLDSGKNSGSAGLGSITYSSTRVTKAVPVVATKGTTGGQPAPWRPPVVNLQYFGGPVMWKPIRVHFIWYWKWAYPSRTAVHVLLLYGKWANPSLKAVIKTAITSLHPPTPTQDAPNLANWWKIVTQYTQTGGAHVSANISVGHEVNDNYSHGHSLGNVAADIIRSNIGPNKLPRDPVSGLYMLMTSSDVAFTGQGFCGYHDFLCTNASQSRTSPFCSNINNRLVFTFMPFPGTGNNLLYGCNVFQPYNAIPLPAPNDAASPVGGALDSFVSVMLHEVMEAATDPYISAWRQNFYENSEAGDFCQYSYGAGDYWYCGLASVYGSVHGGSGSSICRSYPNFHAMKWVSTGQIFNIFGTGGSKFLVQKIWSLASKGCQLQLQDPCKATTTLTAKSGVIERGVHAFGSIPLQTYGPGEKCQWTIKVSNANTLTLTFTQVATGYDQRDHINVYQGSILKQTINGTNLNKVVVSLKGNSAVVKWTSYGGSSPFPDATGFYMTYTST